jgi:hypothetical protein
MKAWLEGRRVVAYAIIPDVNYKTTIRREHAIVVEKDTERRLSLIAKAAPWVGTLRRCPDCGAWFLHEPLKKAGVGREVLREFPTRAKKTVRRKGARPPAKRKK